MVKAILPGSFDPPTLGHVDLVSRCSRLVGELHLVIAENSTKAYLLGHQKRKELLQELVREQPNVRVVVWDGLVSDYARKIGATLLFRGVRSTGDFNYEYELAVNYRYLYPELEVLMVPTRPEFMAVRSSLVREIARMGGRVDGLVPEAVVKMLHLPSDG